MAGGPYADDEWTVGELRDDDGPGMIVRFRSHLPAPEVRKIWGHLVIVGWPYEADDASGMPEKKEARAQDAFEDALFKRLEADGAGCQAASITGEGVREWRYYTPDPDLFMQSLNEALQGHPDYPLEFEAFEDPDWNGLAELLPPRN